jgi:hypothetical protein
MKSKIRANYCAAAMLVAPYLCLQNRGMPPITGTNTTEPGSAYAIL